MCLKDALYESEQRIEQLKKANEVLEGALDIAVQNESKLEAQNKELKKIARYLWLAQFAPLNKEDKKEVNALMRKNGIEVYP